MKNPKELLVALPFAIMLATIALLILRTSNGHPLRDIDEQLKTMSLNVEDIDIGEENEKEGYFIHSIQPLTETSLRRIDVIRKADHALFMTLVGTGARIKVGDRVKIKMITIRPTAAGLPCRIYTLDLREPHGLQ